MSQRRLFSCAGNCWNREIVAPFKSQSQGSKVTFSKNIPINKRQKAWEKDGESKDDWFKRKYAHVHSRSMNREYDSKKGLTRRNNRSGYIAKENDTFAEGNSRYSSDSYRDDDSDKPRRNSRYSSDRSRNDDNDQRRRFYNRDPLSRLKPSPMHDYVFGIGPVMAALKSNKREVFSELLYHNPKERHGEIMKLANDRDVICKSSTKMALNQLTNNNVHNGYVLKTKPLLPQEITRLTSFDRETSKYGILKNPFGQEEIDSYEVARKVAGKTACPFGIYLDEISDPHNVGLIIRTAYYLGVDFIVMSEKNCSKLTAVVSKASSGTMEILPIYSTNKSVDFFEKSQKEGWKFIGAVASNTNKSSKNILVDDLNSIVDKNPTILVFGSEGSGIRTNLMSRSNYLVSLESNRKDLDEVIDSLNVSVAAGLLLQKLLE